MKITSELPDIAAYCEDVLEGFVLAAQRMIEEGVVPPYPQMVKGVRYALEPEGSEDWKLPHNVIRDGWGDCEDLALWQAGGHRATGTDPEARVVIVRTARNKLHAMVMRGSGVLEDPSVDCMTAEDLARYTNADNVAHA